MLTYMGWNNLFEKVTRGYLSCKCEVCGTPWPCLKAGGYSIEPFKWTCSPACFDVHVERIIRSISPEVVEADGTHWGPTDVDAALRNAGSGPSLRLQLERAIEKAEKGYQLDAL